MNIVCNICIFSINAYSINCINTFLLPLRLYVSFFREKIPLYTTSDCTKFPKRISHAPLLTHWHTHTYTRTFTHVAVAAIYLSYRCALAGDSLSLSRERVPVDWRSFHRSSISPIVSRVSLSLSLSLSLSPQPRLCLRCALQEIEFSCEDAPER